MDYRKYSAEDFALDEKFQKWVLDPDAALAGFWEKWLKENPEQQAQVSKAIKLVRAAGLSSDPKLNEAYLSIWKNLNDHVLQTKEVRHNRMQYFKAAAVFIGVAVVSFVLWNQFSKQQTIEYRTAFGEVMEFVLEDGSKVTLNSNSYLTFEKGWDKADTREVFLKGEAFFEVVKLSDLKSFEVKTEEQVHVQVLGTEFNVSTRREQVEVYLQSGKVKVNSLAGEATLAPGDFVVYQQGDQSLVVKQNTAADSQELLSWKSSLFIFNDTPLTEVVKALEDNYGFTVVLKDKVLSQRKITAKIPRNDVGVLLKVLSETLDVEITREGDRLTFTD